VQTAVLVTSIHRFNSHNKINKYMYVKCVYHTVFITNMFHSPSQPSSGQFMRILGIYKHIRNPKSPSKCINEPLDIMKNVSDPLFSH